VVTTLQSTLDKAVADATSCLANLTERCLETDDRADEMTAKVRARWQRRLELMRTRANTAGAARDLGLS
jgi:hypothetical protein